MLFNPGPAKVMAYYCKQCERVETASGWEPAECKHCDCKEFWSELDLGAPCNRQGEEENV